jgi:hypothetical protein
MIKTKSCTRLFFHVLTITSVFVGSALQASDYPTTILADNPVAYYRFEELPGSSAALNSSTNGAMFNGAYQYNSLNSPTLGLPGIDTNSISFVFGSGGPSDYGDVDIPYSSVLAPVQVDGSSGAPFSMEIWARATTQPAAGTYGVPVADNGPYGGGIYGNSSGWNLYQSPGPNSSWIFDLRPGAFVQLESTITLLAWYHLAMTYDGTNVTCYVNGLSQGTYSAVGYLANPAYDIIVGAGPNTGQNPFQGGLDEFAMYDYPLTAAQVLTHYQVGTNSFRPTFVGAGILLQPASVTNYSGTTATIVAQGYGTLPLSYQWYRGASEISGATNSSYSFVPLYPADNGSSFSVIVTNNYGSATSIVATVTVLTNVNIVTPPVPITRNSNSYAAFRVVANGALPITYQWSVSTNGAATYTPLTGQTLDTLWLTNVPMSFNNNYYSVTVSNPFTSSSAAASLNVQARAVNVPITGYARFVAADHPVAYWRLDETNADYGTATDALGSFDGTYADGSGSFIWDLPTGIPHETDGAVGMTNGATVQIPYAVELNPDGAWSGEMWLQPTVVDGNYRVVWSSEYNNSTYSFPYNGWYIYLEPGGVFAFVPQPGNAFITATPDDPANGNAVVANKWYHLVVTDDTTNFTVYINGEARTGYPVASSDFIANGDGINPDGSSGTSNPREGAQMVLGMRTDLAFSPFEGTVDDTAVYNYALTAQQIKTHFANQATLLLTKTGAQIVLTWSVGTLESSTNVNGPYTTVVGATSPYVVTPTGAHMFYRLQTLP